MSECQEGAHRHWCPACKAHHLCDMEICRTYQAANGQMIGEPRNCNEYSGQFWTAEQAATLKNEL